MMSHKIPNKSKLILCALLSTIVFIYLLTNRESDMALFSTDFEVFGRVQGVFFRKYTQKKALELGLKGWCRNTADGTVVGQLEGKSPSIQAMHVWLQKTGSPHSRIDRAVFSPEKPIEQYLFNDFAIRQ